MLVIVPPHLAGLQWQARRLPYFVHHQVDDNAVRFRRGIECVALDRYLEGPFILYVGRMNEHTPVAEVRMTRELELGEQVDQDLRFELRILGGNSVPGPGHL